MGWKARGPPQCAGHTWQPALAHAERPRRASAELTWNARLRARGAGQVPGKINSTEPSGGECWLLLCIAALCQVICDFMLASIPKGELFLRSPQLAIKSRLKTRICLGDSRQDQTQPAQLAGSNQRAHYCKTREFYQKQYSYLLQRPCAAFPHTGLQPGRSSMPPALGQQDQGRRVPLALNTGAELGSSSLCCSAPALGHGSTLLQPCPLCCCRERALGDCGRLTATQASPPLPCTKYWLQMQFEALL